MSSQTQWKLVRTLILLVIVLIAFSGPTVSTSEIRSKDLVGEGSFFWDRDPRSDRWIPRIFLFLNNTSRFTLHIDHVNVTFSEIVYENGTQEGRFSLSSKEKIDVMTGANLLVVTMSEFGFSSKPTNLRFELSIHVAETDGRLVFTSDNTVSPLSMGRLLQSIMLQYDILGNGTVLASYSMTFRNLGTKEIRAQIAIRFLEEKYPLCDGISPSIDDPDGGKVHVEHLGKKASLIYVMPYYRTIAGGSSYAVKLRFALKDVVDSSEGRHVIRDLRLVQPAYVVTAVLKVRIPKEKDSLYSLMDVDSSPPAEGSSISEISGGQVFYTLSWSASAQRDPESFYIINVSRISYQYSLDLSRVGLWDILKGIIISIVVALIGYMCRWWRNRKTRLQYLQGLRTEIEDSIRLLQNRKGQLLPNDQWTHILISGGLKLLSSTQIDELGRAYFGISNYDYEAKRARDMGERYRSEADEKSRKQIHLAWQLTSQQLFSMGDGLLHTLQTLLSREYFRKDTRM